MSSDTNTTALKISLRARTYQLYWSGENSGDNFFLFFSRWKVKTHSWHSQVFETGLWIWSQLQREGNFKQVRKKFQEGEVNMERSVHEDVRPLPLPLAQGQAWTSRYDCHSCAKKDLENHLFIKFDQILLENAIWRQNISTFTSTKSNVFYMKSEFSPALSLSSPCLRGINVLVPRLNKSIIDGLAAEKPDFPYDTILLYSLITLLQGSWVRIFEW